MISRTHRFHGHHSLDRVYSRGQTIRDPRISLKSYLNQKSPNFKVAVVVSKKTAKSAVVRNKIRRRIYEIIRVNSNDIIPGQELVFSVYSKEVARLDKAELEGLILSHLKKAKATKAL